MNDRDSGANVAVPLGVAVRRRRQENKERPKRQPRYNVILWNDDDHTYEYVIAMLMELFGYTVERGYLLAQEVHQTGKAVLLTTTLEHAELKRDQIHAFGKDLAVTECLGSMWATVEAVDR